MAKKPRKLNSMRLLEQQGVLYEVFEFSPDIHSAVGVAEAAGIPPELVYKTLVVTRDQGKPLLAIIPGPALLDLKALAGTVCEKKLTMAAHAEAEKLTGLKVGGISALALTQKRWAVVIDSAALDHETILVSAGQRGLNLKVPVDGLMRVVNAKAAAIARPAD